MSNLAKRILTAIFLLLIAGSALAAGTQYFIYLAHLIVFLMQLELGQMLFKKKYPHLIWPFITTSFTTTLVYNYLPVYFLPFLFLMISIAFSSVLICFSKKSNDYLVEVLGLLSLGYLYVGILPSIATKILMLQDGFLWMVICIFVVFSGDIGAYFVGSRMGKTKILPHISPNKTWEGSIGGTFCSVIISIFIGQYLFPEKNIMTFVLSGFFASVLAQSGDFFESLLKRISGQKDSGQLLPGHGGFLDRFDSFLFAIPIYYFLSLY